MKARAQCSPPSFRRIMREVHELASELETANQAVLQDVVSLAKGVPPREGADARTGTCEVHVLVSAGIGSARTGTCRHRKCTYYGRVRAGT